MLLKEPVHNHVERLCAFNTRTELHRSWRLEHVLRIPASSLACAWWYALRYPNPLRPVVHGAVLVYSDKDRLHHIQPAVAACALAQAGEAL